MLKPVILCIDNDPNILDLLSFNLQTSGYSVRTLSQGKDAVSIASYCSLVIHDLTLPDIHGHDIIRALRDNPATATIPIVVLTAVDSEGEIVRAFELGADDYVTKPFGVRELMARVKAVLRRSSDRSAAEDIRIGPIYIDSDNYEAFRNDQKLMLTLKEYELLKLLASCPGKVLTRDFLLDRIWGYEYHGETRTVDVHIRHIRQKLGEDCTMIETIRGVGYKMRTTA